MSVLMIRFEVAEDGVAEVSDAAKATFAALEASAIEGVRYEYYRRAGTPEFVALLELADGVENPLPGIPAARDLQSAVAKWVVGEAPVPQPLEPVGSYAAVR